MSYRVQVLVEFSRFDFEIVGVRWLGIGHCVILVRCRLLQEWIENGFGQDEGDGLIGSESIS